MITKAENFQQETIARWEEFCMTRKSVPHAAVLAWLESWCTENERATPFHCLETEEFDSLTEPMNDD